MSGRCIMMCAGDYHPMEIERRPDDFVIAVDGGLSRLLRQGIEPDFLLGDFDSLDPSDGNIVERFRKMGESAFYSCRSSRMTPIRWQRQGWESSGAIESS